MLLTIVLILTLLLGIAMIIIFDYDHLDSEGLLGVGIVITVFTAITLAIYLIGAVFTGPSDDREFMRKFEAVRTTLNEQRASKELTQYERVSLTQTIIGYNIDLAKRQYWSKSKWIGQCYDQRINNVQPLK